MNCPVCGMEMEEVKIDAIAVDVCKQGCGGLWFDRFELKKVDEPHESAGEGLLMQGQGRGKPDPSQKRMCPKCEKMPLMRHFFSVKKEVEVDECPKCGGFWLDGGELAQIRGQFGSEEERKQAAKVWCGNVAEEGLADMRAASAEGRERAQKIRTMFRFICPSTYLSGGVQEHCARGLECLSPRD